MQKEVINMILQYDFLLLGCRTSSYTLFFPQLHTLKMCMENKVVHSRVDNGG